MAAEHRRVSASARVARIWAMICALAMLALAAWLDWQHSVGTLISLDAERTLTLAAFLVLHASVLFLAAQPARYVSRPLGVRTALVIGAAAGVNVGAAAFFLIDAALAASVLADQIGPSWLVASVVPALTSLLLFIATVRAPPDEPDEISDDDIAEAALILTESQRRWSWQAVFGMAWYMAYSRTVILAVYFAWLVVGTAVFDWLSKAFLDTRPLTAADLRATETGAIEQASYLLTHGWIWTIFVLVAVLPALLILGAAAWYRFQVRRQRAWMRTLSQSPMARFMTANELAFLQREIERPLLAQMRAAAQRREQGRSVS